MYTFAVLIGYRLRAPPAGDRYEELKRYPSRSPSAGFTGCAFGSITLEVDVGERGSPSFISSRTYIYIIVRWVRVRVRFR